MFPSCKNQSVDLPVNQLTGFYVMGGLVVKRLTCFFHCWLGWLISSIIRQKGVSQNVCYKKTKHAKFSEKLRFLTPCVYQGVKNFRFRKIWRACFLVTPVLRFSLWSYYGRYTYLQEILLFNTSSLINSSYWFLPGKS